MKLEELGQLVNDIKNATDDVTRSQHLASLVDDYSNMLNQMQELTTQNATLTESNTKYAQLNQDLFLKVGLGASNTPITPQGNINNPLPGEQHTPTQRYEDLKFD